MGSRLYCKMSEEEAKAAAEEQETEETTEEAGKNETPKEEESTATFEPVVKLEEVEIKAEKRMRKSYMQCVPSYLFSERPFLIKEQVKNHGKNVELVKFVFFVTGNINVSVFSCVRKKL